MDELWRVLRDPRVSIVLVLGSVVAAGTALVLLGYRSIAAEVLVAAQLPYVVSTSLTGLALIGTGLRLLVVHLDRVEAAVERRQLAEIQRETLRVLAARQRRD